MRERTMDEHPIHGEKLFCWTNHYASEDFINVAVSLRSNWSFENQRA